MRKLMLLLAAVVAVFASTAAAAPSGHGAMIARDHARGAHTTVALARVCNEIVGVSVHPDANPPYIKTGWSTNSCIWWQRSFVHCRNGRSLIFAFGGWKTGVDVFSTAVCPSGYGFLQGAGFDTKHTASGALTRHWSYGN